MLQAAAALARRLTGRLAPALWPVAVAALLATDGAQAATQGSVTAGLEAGFARLVFQFDEPVAHETSVANGVLVMTLAAEVEIDLSQITSQVPGYVAAARIDPDRTTLRFALARHATVNTIAARERLYVDLLPDTWTGPPPGLPEEVVAELIRLAQEEAARASARGRRQDAGRDLLSVRVGRYPTFSRVVFDWDEPTETVLSREDETVVLRFDREAKADLTRLNVDPPPYLVRAKARRGEGTLTVNLEVDPGTNVRGFREGDTYVVDLSGSETPVRVVDPAATETAMVVPDLPPVPLQSAEVELPSTPASDDPPETEDAVSITVTPLELGVGPADGEAESGMSEDAETSPAAGDIGDDASDGDAGPAPEAGIEDEVAVVNTDPNAPVVVAAKMIGSTLRITFPFAEPVASAAFQRARTLWVVFDSDATIETGAIMRQAGDMVTDLDLVRSESMQVLRLSLSGEFLATSTAEDHQWIVSIGDQVLAPTEPLVLERGLREDGRSKVSVKLENGGRVHWIADREIGDRLAVVTLYGPPRGQIKEQEFVEFTALPTAHGLAIRPHADDLAVRLAQDEVVITRERGLFISAGRWPAYVPGQSDSGDATRPGFIDFASADDQNPLLLRRNVQRLVSAIAETPPEQRANLRQQLAQLLVSHQLAAEALGVMRLAVEEDPEIVNDPMFHAMRGVARLMQGRIEEARDDFAAYGLTQDPHVALWRALIDAEDENWRDVATEIEDNLAALEAYPIRHQARFRLAAARAGLETNDLEMVVRHLDVLSRAELSRDEAAERDLLRARLAETQGNVEDAMKQYSRLATSRVRPVAAEAELYRINLFLRSGRMTTESAISALESLEVVWRGDLIELAALRKLAELYGRAGRYRDALETMKTAIVNHDPGQLTQLISDDMTSMFNHLFLDGGASDMPPIEALGLYYDFRELTPVGRRGDEMIRKLASRLVDVDLLDQAADLLEHQVNNRLSGIARAQVASELSLIYLMSHKPELALRAIRQTRQAVLPEKLQNRRNILEARALADLGRVELAVEILDSMHGNIVERLKADALWRGQRWLAAGEQIERLLGARWQKTAPLGDAERLDVLRAAIAYALADDSLGLDRLRRKYVSKMAASPDANAFDMVTGGIERDAAAVSALARQVSETDTMEEFLDELRTNFGEGDQLDPTASAGAGSDAAS